MIYTIYGEKYHKHDPIIDHRTKEIIDDGLPKKVKLGSWPDKKIADTMAENIKTNTGKRQWKIWVEST